MMAGQDLPAPPSVPDRSAATAGSGETVTDPLEVRALSGAVLEPRSVALVGGGPGALDLITVRGLALLRQADVVVVDRLGPVGLVDLLPEGVEIIPVGKAPGQHSMRQADIEQVLVDQARAGKRVVRLKGGDPFLLGRGGEEVIACRAAGIDVQVVPGVTSSIAGPAAGDVPVTHRGTAVAVHVVNAHGDLGPADLAALRDAGTTTVLMMGVEWLPRLVSQAMLNGVSGHTPVAIVQSATLPEQKVARGTLATIEQVVAEQQIQHPAVIVVGATAAEGFLAAPEPEGTGRGAGRDNLTAPQEEPEEPFAARTDSPVLIGCAHGTRFRGGRDVIRELLVMASQLVDAPVRESFVDIQAPAIDDAVAAHAGPSVATRPDTPVTAVVVPVLLSTGYHVRKDIGSAVAGRTAVAAPPLGPDERLATVMAERLLEAGLTEGDTVVMAAAGTSDPDGLAMVEQMRDLLAETLGAEIGLGYVAASEPDMTTAVTQAREGGAGRVVVASYMLAPGHFQKKLESAGADVVAEPLGTHPLVAEIIADRYRAAVGD
ncbi:uroporphyrinogen-III C-methyltransferase [Brachybacterium muris]|uniref:uroporphyrinogen-III C-methyltransferase n=1 Tax=Brachybacterium muris TaxID=219301 RepID=UPI00223B5C7D|nr:uroporphyrinogen-III C-methyltransferase [Brachybacterium muris]MCT2262737.1 uroporphyrinogen-III C-methyltransferase [Brachybacterium muris]MCT2296870.1 uroporphyrinogen-III C-methyltransferase [Brachybacterium muris]